MRSLPRRARALDAAAARRTSSSPSTRVSVIPLPGTSLAGAASPAARRFELLHVGTLEPVVMRRFASPKREF